MLPDGIEPFALQAVTALNFLKRDERAAFGLRRVQFRGGLFVDQLLFLAVEPQESQLAQSGVQLGRRQLCDDFMKLLPVSHKIFLHQA